jgi:hypothetical protein
MFGNCMNRVLDILDLLLTHVSEGNQQNLPDLS